MLDQLRAARRAVLLVVIGGVPLILLVGVTNDPYNVPKLGLLVAGAGIAWAIRLVEVALGGQSSKWREALIPAAGFAVPLSVAWLLSPYQEWASMGSYARFMGLWPYLVVIGFALLVADAFKKDATPILAALAMAGGIVGTYAFLQVLGIDPLARFFENPPITSAISTIGNTNFVGGFLGITLPVAVVLWGTQTGTRKRLAMLATIMIADGLIFSFSQGGYAAAFAGCSLALGGLLRRRWMKAWPVGLAAASAVSVIVLVIIVAPLINPDLPVGTTARIRGFWWTAAIRMAADNPLIGQGPSTFAIEGPSYRSMQDVLTTPYETPDNPHSVFLSMLASAGILGGVGFLLTASWCLVRGIKTARNDTAALALTAATTAYLVQSLVSVDVLTLRVAFWTCVGGIASIGAARDAATRLHATPEKPDNEKKVVFTLGTLLVAIVLIMASSAWAAGFILADIRVRNGSKLFEEQAAGEARRQFELALSFRDEREYRLIYGEKLGLAALDARLQDQALVTDTIHQFERAISMPDFRPIANYARMLHYFGSFVPAYDQIALDLYNRALRLNPYNPLLRVDTSDVLLAMGRAHEVLPMLTEEGRLLGSNLAVVWATVSMAQTLEGHYDSAEAALGEAEARSKMGCRTLIAEELLHQYERSNSEPPTPSRLALLSFNCPPAEYQLLVDLLPRQLEGQYQRSG